MAKVHKNASANWQIFLTTSKLCKLKSYSVVSRIGLAMVCLSFQDIPGNTFRKC
jgi:hypothetical protein